MNLLQLIGKKAANFAVAQRSRPWLYIAVVAIVYGAAKLYVASTPSPHDDNIPDQVKDILLAYHETDESAETDS